MTEWRFKTIYFVGGSRLMNEELATIVERGQEEGFEFHDLKFAQSSASGSGMSAIVIMRKTSLSVPTKS